MARDKMIWQITESPDLVERSIVWRPRSEQSHIDVAYGADLWVFEVEHQNVFSKLLVLRRNFSRHYYLRFRQDDEIHPKFQG